MKKQLMHICITVMYNGIVAFTNKIDRYKAHIQTQILQMFLKSHYTVSHQVQWRQNHNMS